MTKIKSYRISDDDQDLIDSIMTTHNITTEIGALRFALKSTYNGTSKKIELPEEVGEEVEEEIIEETPNLILRNGEIYITDADRAERKRIAAENSAKLLVETPHGMVSPKLAEVLVNVKPKVLVENQKVEINEEHRAPGIFQQMEESEGVDEVYED